MKRFFRDKRGQMVWWQWPSPLLWGWLVARVLALALTDGTLKDWVGYAGTASLAIWALLELTTGVNYFRKLLGLVVLLMIVLQFFLQ